MGDSEMIEPLQSIIAAVIELCLEMHPHFVGAVTDDRSENANALRRTWFLIHLSKSAGSTICATATKQSMGYRTMKRPFAGHNCNLPKHLTPVKNDDRGLFDCKAIAALQKKVGDVEFMASERPITGKTTHEFPTLCDDFLYIFPIREPQNSDATPSKRQRLFRCGPMRRCSEGICPTHIRDGSDGTDIASEMKRKRQTQRTTHCLRRALRLHSDICDAQCRMCCACFWCRPFNSALSTKF